MGRHLWRFVYYNWVVHILFCKNGDAIVIPNLAHVLNMGSIICRKIYLSAGIAGDWLGSGEQIKDFDCLQIFTDAVLYGFWRGLLRDLVRECELPAHF